MDAYDSIVWLAVLVEKFLYGLLYWLRNFWDLLFL